MVKLSFEHEQYIAKKVAEKFRHFYKDCDEMEDDYENRLRIAKERTNEIKNKIKDDIDKISKDLGVKVRVAIAPIDDEDVRYQIYLLKKEPQKMRDYKIFEAKFLASRKQRLTTKIIDDIVNSLDEDFGDKFKRMGFFPTVTYEKTIDTDWIERNLSENHLYSTFSECKDRMNYIIEKYKYSRGEPFDYGVFFFDGNNWCQTTTGANVVRKLSNKEING